MTPVIELFSFVAGVSKVVESSLRSRRVGYLVWAKFLAEYLRSRAENGEETLLSHAQKQ